MYRLRKIFIFRGKIMAKIKTKSLIQLTKSITRGITPSYTEENGVKVINQRCVRNNLINLKEARLTDPNEKKINDKKILHKGDILINSTGVGTVGRSAQLKDMTEKLTVDSHVTIVRPNDEVNAEYLGYNIQMLEKEIENLAEGSTGQIELSRERLGNEIIIMYTSLDNQEKIVKILKSIDKKIELNTKINNNYSRFLMMYG